MMSSHTSSGKSTVGARLILPAQLIRMSTLPHAFTVSSSRCCNVARSPTSEVSRSALRPLDSICAAASSTCSCRRELATTSAPASANPTAMASPIPDVPPTTTAVFPVKSNNEFAIEIFLSQLLRTRTLSVCHSDPDPELAVGEGEESPYLPLVQPANYRWMRADPPCANCTTWSSVAMVVSPGNVVISAPCAHPSFTASSGVLPLNRP